MAKVFLSYARDDRYLVEPLANLLELAGHAVWWDRHIAGGSDFSSEIAAALEASEVVIVAWSPASVGSHWVKDEAAEGRDRGRLVPVLLGPTMPPLGFRQIQAIDLSEWEGEGRPAAFEELLRAIDLIAASGDRPPLRKGARPMVAPSQEHSPAATPKRGRTGFIVALAVALLLIAAAAVFLLLPRGEKDVVTAPVTDSTPPSPATEAPSKGSGTSDLDGRWRLRWSVAGSPYRAVMVVSGQSASLDVEVATSLGQQRVQQQCSISGSATVNVGCHSARVVSGPPGYAPDSFTFETQGRNRMTGTTSDPLGLSTETVAAERE